MDAADTHEIMITAHAVGGGRTASKGSGPKPSPRRSSARVQVAKRSGPEVPRSSRVGGADEINILPEFQCLICYISTSVGRGEYISSKEGAQHKSESAL